ncbi:NADH:flavin oxidoreductase/NADH oxidase [Isoptericola sp. NPDC019482]|uniref:NADH:flavin oxidoreductase/NADH oxidase n=1 Tax=Isoptericola sp. NPDC019482 TaxID=3154688 RepID=UPI00346BBF83
MPSALFAPLPLRAVTLPNRIVMAPMCQYSAEPSGPQVGVPTDWHVQHYGSRAVGRPGLVLVEATAVSPEGRISPYDLGLWNAAQVSGHRRLTALMRQQGVVPGVQLAHAGRKASTGRPSDGGGALAPEEGLGWQVLAPSALPFADGSPLPEALPPERIGEVVAQFAAAARRAVEAGYEAVEVHAAHGYLLHEFLSPLSNHRTDSYGGSFEGRARLVLEVVDAVRGAVGDDVPVLTRLSATDWAEPEGWTADDTVRLSGLLREHGVDVVHVSTGGNVPDATIPVGPGYQVPFAARVRREAGVTTAAVGLVRDPQHAEQLVAEGEADLVALGRELLLDPYWPVRAARELGADWSLPPQYDRAELLARRDERTASSATTA